MDAYIVSLLHVAPRANEKLMNHITSEDLEDVGSDIHEIWCNLTKAGRFKGVATENLLELICTNAPTPQTSEYLKLRYGGMN